MVKDDHTETFDRLKPPVGLNDEETEVWAVVIATQEPDWFNEANAYLLVQYCRHVVAAKRIGELAERNSGNAQAYLQCLKEQRAETVSIKSTATAMRISQQSTRTHRGNARTTISQARVPWQNAK